MAVSVCLNTTVNSVIVQGILVPAMREDESFSFCMCNPPFFSNFQEAGCNPHTAYAGNLRVVCTLSCSWFRRFPFQHFTAYSILFSLHEFV